MRSGRVDLGGVEELVAAPEEIQRGRTIERTGGGTAGRSGHAAVSLAEAPWPVRTCHPLPVHASLIPPGTLTPAQRTPPPRTVARVCMNGHLAEDTLAASVARRVPTNRADPLAVVTTDVRCARCPAGTILGCPGCSYPIPGRLPGMPYDVPHFCVVCGEYYPWTFRGEFYATLEEIARLADAFHLLGGSDWDLAAQILRVVLPADTVRRLDLAARFSH